MADGGWTRTRAHRRWAWLVAAVAVLPLAVLPVRAVADVWRAPALLPQQLGTRGLEVLTDSGTRVAEAVGTSLLVALLATALALVLGWPAARQVARAPSRRRLVVLAVIGLPLLVPPYAVGTGLTSWLLRLGLADTVPGLVAAHLVYVLPYVVLALTPAFGAQLHRQEEAARTLGATGPARLWLVTLPATGPSTALAALLGFLVSWSQYGTSLAVGGGRLTLPVVLLPFVERDPRWPPPWRWCSWSRRWSPWPPCNVSGGDGTATNGPRRHGRTGCSATGRYSGASSGRPARARRCA